MEKGGGGEGGWRKKRDKKQQLQTEKMHWQEWIKLLNLLVMQLHSYLHGSLLIHVPNE